MLLCLITTTFEQGVHRVSASVGGAPLWFESADVALSPSPEAFASAMLIPAIARGESLTIEGSLSDVWLSNVNRILPVFREWWDYPELAPQPASAGCENATRLESTALCFSGGVDSFYSLLRSGYTVDYLVFVIGFDMRLDDVARASAFESSLREVAAETGAHPIIIRTNLREHPAFTPVTWERTHGGALAAIGRLMSDTVGQLLISASQTYDQTTPLGSHWRTDRLWSSEKLQIVTVGAEPHRHSISTMIWTLAGLLGGLLIGLIVHRWRRPELLAFVSLVEPVGKLWTNALQMTLIPLIVSQLVCAIAATAGYKTIGRLGGLSLLTFLALLTIGAIFALVVVPPLVARFKVNPDEVAALQASAHGQTRSKTTGAGGEGASFGEGIAALVPSNPVKAAADGAMLPLIVFTILFALAITRIAEEQRQSLLSFFQALGEVAFVLVRWALKPMPVGVFALALPMAANAGWAPIGAVGYFILINCLILLCLTLLLYPPAMLFGRVNLGAFARAAAPAQAVAVSSRSSLAALPALIDGANRWLRLPGAVTGFVLPLCVSVFKASQPCGSVFKLLFIAHLYGVELDPLRIAVFTVMVTLVSFSVAGLPGAGTMQSIPVFLAAGVPLEPILLFNAVDAIPDIFRTLANVTGDMTALTIVARLAGVSASGAMGAAIGGAGDENI